MNTDLEAQRAIDRLARDGIASLTETERTIAAVWLFAAGVGNGGFVGYFASHRGELAAMAPKALRAIGAVELAGLSEQANAILAPEGPPMDREARRALVHALSDSAHEALRELDRRYLNSEEDIDERLELFLDRKNGTART